MARRIIPPGWPPEVLLRRAVRDFEATANRLAALRRCRRFFRLHGPCGGSPSTRLSLAVMSQGTIRRPALEGRRSRLPPRSPRDRSSARRCRRRIRRPSLRRPPTGTEGPPGKATAKAVVLIEGSTARRRLHPPVGATTTRRLTPGGTARGNGTLAGSLPVFLCCYPARSGQESWTLFSLRVNKPCPTQREVFPRMYKFSVVLFFAGAATRGTGPIREQDTRAGGTCEKN